MHVEATAIPDVKVVTTERFGDERGFFSEVYNARRFADAGIELRFVQDNHSLSSDVGVLRGLHFQVPPFAQDKLVRVIRGRILDVAVDLRRTSPTFGRHVAVELSAENFRQILVPMGFAHGFVTREPDTEIIYKVTNHYSREHDRGIIWNDPELAIDWGISADEVTLSDKDARLPTFAESPDLFD
jgi:dTDP-4-dehydrorhamnose 3,5-epimerase